MPNLVLAGTRLLLSVLSLTLVCCTVGSGKEHSEPSAPVSAASLNHIQADWDEYRLADGEFSVQLPTVPAMTSYRARPEPQDKIRLLHLISAYSQGVVYVVRVYERKQSLEDFIRSFGRPESSFNRNLHISGVQGKEYAFQNDMGKGKTEYFITDTRIYVFETWGSPLGNPDIGFPRFFGSIKLDRPLTGHVIVDGPGESVSAEVNEATNATNTKVFSSKEITSKFVVISKPEPMYTEAARGKQITGTVVLACVFSSDGAVTNLRVVKSLSDGLTENSIAAARQIKFIPAIKDGHFVSMYMHLEYNFNLY